jgi:hypothetical protein
MQWQFPTIDINQLFWNPGMAAEHEESSENEKRVATSITRSTAMDAAGLDCTHPLGMQSHPQ